MDNKSAVALTVGLGALGTVLAYYGYNHLNEDDSTTTDFQIDKPTQTAAVTTADELRKIAKKKASEEKAKQEKANQEKANQAANTSSITNNVAMAIKELHSEKAKPAIAPK